MCVCVCACVCVCVCVCVSVREREREREQHNTDRHRTKHTLIITHNDCDEGVDAIETLSVSLVSKIIFDCCLSWMGKPDWDGSLQIN